MKRVKNKRNLVISAFLGLSIVIFSTWGAVAPLLVYALPPALLKARTIAELILTLFAGSGTAVTSSPVLQTIYAYDSAYYSMESMINNDILIPADPNVTKAEALDYLGTATTHTGPFNLDAQAFRQYVTSNWQSMKDYGIDTVLRFNEIANTDSTYGAIDNLGQIVKNVANYGYLGASNTIAIVANPGTVAQVTFDHILEAIKNVYGSFINNGVGLENIQAPAGQIIFGDGTYKGTQNSDGTRYLLCYETKMPYAFYGKTTSSTLGYVIYNPYETTKYVSYQYSNPKTGYNYWVTGVNFPSKQVSTRQLAVNSWWIVPPGSPLFDTVEEAIAYLNQFKNGEVDLEEYDSTSPDVINQNQGNVTNLNNVSPAVDEGGMIYPIDSDDYDNFVNDTNQDKGVTNAPIMQEFLSPYLGEEPEIKEPWEDPEIPVTNPMLPEQPTYPDKPIVTDNDKEEALLTSIDGITSVFPFCIPWDLLAFVREFKVEREAPVIVWNFKIDRFDIDYTFEIDMSQYDTVAQLLRTMELILFIIGLAVKTRELIGA